MGLQEVHILGVSYITSRKTEDHLIRKHPGRNSLPKETKPALDSTRGLSQLIVGSSLKTAQKFTRVNAQWTPKHVL